MEDLAWVKNSFIKYIGNQILENIPDARVKYIPAETFINDFLSGKIGRDGWL